jgi:hypothetical protein
MSAYYEGEPVRPLRPGDPTVIHRPLVSVRAIGPKQNQVYEGLLDTGADETILPWSDLEWLGVQLLPRVVADIEGVGGSLRVMYGFVDLEFNGPDGPIRWSHLAAFGQRKRAIFGLNGFLEYFVARFDGVKHEVKLQYRGKAPAPRFEPPAPRRPR